MQRYYLCILLFAFVSCDDAVDVGKCPSNSLSGEVAGLEAWVDGCDSCHASTATNRNGAPSGIVTDDLEYVRANKSELYGETESGSMPPSGSLSDTKVENIRIWLACGAKSQSDLEAEQAADNDENTEDDTAG